MSLFPFTLHANQLGHSPAGFRLSFLKIKPDDLTWYCFDVTIKSRTELTFTVYDMLDSFSGGIGRQIASFDAVVEPTITDRVIERRAYMLATERRQNELDAAEALIVNQYAEEILRAET